MTKVVYEIVEHDGGWSYRVDGVYSRRGARGEGTGRSGRDDGQGWALARRSFERHRSAGQGIVRDVRASTLLAFVSLSSLA
jgi:hypothetical protein